MQKLYALLHGIARLILEPCVLLQQLGKMWRNGPDKVQPQKTECLKQRLFSKERRGDCFLKERRGKNEDQVST